MHSPPPLVLAGDTPAVLSHLPDIRSWLTPVELARADRLRRPQDRDAFRAAHGLARLCAARLLDTDAQRLIMIQRCDRCGGPHGQPTLLDQPTVGISLSRSDGYVAAAAGHGPVGVDVERPGRLPLDPAVLTLSLAAAELRAVNAAPSPHHAFTRQWVRKEALVKVGVATLDEFSTLDLSALPLDQFRTLWQGWHLLEWSDHGTTALGTATARTPPRLVILQPA